MTRQTDTGDQAPDTLSEINMFWHGKRLGELHAACVRSFVKHGHRVVLHCYEEPRDLPEGADTYDANRIMPTKDLIANRATGSVALGTNRYRYRMLRAGIGPYFDCDMYCIRPIPRAKWLFGREDSRRINGAVLSYPSESELASALVESTLDQYAPPPWKGRRDRLKHEVARRLGRPISVADSPWGVWGPQLLTHWIDRLDLHEHVLPSDVFYPLHYWNTGLLRESGLRLRDLTTPRTLAVHLWHNLLGQDPAPKGSPLREVIET